MNDCRDDQDMMAQDFGKGGSRLGAFVASLPTAIKMLIILSAALLPLGLVALFASLDSVANNRTRRADETRLMAIASARQLSTAIMRTGLTLRATTTVLALNQAGIEACRRSLDTLAATQSPVRLAIFDRYGFRRCSTSGFMPPAPAIPDDPHGMRVTMLPDASAIRVTLFGADGNSIGLAEISREVLARIARPPNGSARYSLTIRQDETRMEVARLDSSRPLDQRISTSAPAANGQLAVEMTVRSVPLTAIEALMMMLPLLMWLAAAATGWLVVDRLLLRPLAQLQRAIASYRPGDAGLALPVLTTPAYEIRRLGGAFARLTATVARHERELEEGLERQTKLTREVHHRVKNNLQVIASLINLHARGAHSPETQAAYASIQRRVDALAVVHRNHYAEIEDHEGVALRSLIGELASNLRATAPVAGKVAVALEVDPLYVSQDVAVAVAFLLTELIELAMMNDPAAAITIRLRRVGKGDGPAPDGPARASLSIESDALKAASAEEIRLGERYGRVIEGLTRQLRTQLHRDHVNGCYVLEIAVTA